MKIRLSALALCVESCGIALLVWQQPSQVQNPVDERKAQSVRIESRSDIDAALGVLHAIDVEQTDASPLESIEDQLLKP